jgi:hypothetical protein
MVKFSSTGRVIVPVGSEKKLDPNLFVDEIKEQPMLLCDFFGWMDKYLQNSASYQDDCLNENKSFSRLHKKLNDELLQVYYYLKSRKIGAKYIHLVDESVSDTSKNFDVGLLNGNKKLIETIEVTLAIDAEEILYFLWCRGGRVNEELQLKFEKRREQQLISISPDVYIQKIYQNVFASSIKKFDKRKVKQKGVRSILLLDIVSEGFFRSESSVGEIVRGLRDGLMNDIDRSKMLLFDSICLILNKSAYELYPVGLQ